MTALCHFVEMEIVMVLRESRWTWSQIGEGVGSRGRRHISGWHTGGTKVAREGGIGPCPPGR